MMGLRPSPFMATQTMSWAEEIILGDPLDPTNIFRWDEVVLNLPGMLDYDPTRPWVAKYRSSDGKIACDMLIYIDDLRLTGPTAEECWAASRRAASVCNWLGIQDAPRKRREPSQTPGAWAGSVLSTDLGEVVVKASEEKWLKAKNHIAWLNEVLLSGADFEHERLESARGFLVYMCRAYPAMTPYLKGIHQTLDSWRPDRGQDGWRLSGSERAVLAAAGMLPVVGPRDKPPSMVRSAPRLRDDVDALLQMVKPEVPPRRMVRALTRGVVRYGFGDASGKGFGSTIMLNGVLHYRSGQWSEQIENESSNYRELRNLIEALEEAAIGGDLQGCEIFMFTDNDVAEKAFFNGTSSSRSLFELVLRLRMLELHGGWKLHVVHVAGTRMIEEGADGMSRGVFDAGVMLGHSMMDYVPLHLNALERSPELKTWLLSWLGQEVEFLEPRGWFCEGFKEGAFVWSPPPAAAGAAVEQMARAKHRRPHCLHIAVIPRLMTVHWQKQLLKACDLVIRIPAKVPFWSSKQHEPVLIALALPLCKHRPWRLRSTKLMGDAERSLRSMWHQGAEGSGRFLRQLLARTRSLDTLPYGMVREVLSADFERSLPSAAAQRQAGKRDRHGPGGAAISASKKRRSSDDFVPV